MTMYLDIFGQADLLAYIGPGAGLSMIGALIAVACVLLLALVGPILYPIRLIRTHLRRRRERAEFSQDHGEPGGVATRASS